MHNIDNVTIMDSTIPHEAHLLVFHVYHFLSRATCSQLGTNLIVNSDRPFMALHSTKKSFKNIISDIVSNVDVKTVSVEQIRVTPNHLLQCAGPRQLLCCVGNLTSMF